MFYRILQWLTRLRRASSYPRGFFFHGVVIFVFTIIPFTLWMRRLLESPEVRLDREALRYCPPTAPAVLSDVLRYPERYQLRSIWLTGILREGERHCFQRACAPRKVCCHPCHARLILESGSVRLHLSGLPKEGGLSCQGTSCSMACGAYQVGQPYAAYGLPRLRREFPPDGKPIRFSMKSFWVQRLCKMNHTLPSSPYALPDPRLPAVLRRLPVSRPISKTLLRP